MQVVQVVCFALATTPKNDHLIVPDKCGRVTFTRARRFPSEVQLSPLFGPEIQYMKVINLSRAVRAPKHYHPVPHKNSTVTVPRARSLAGGRKSSPNHIVEIKNKHVTKMQTSTASLKMDCNGKILLIFSY